MKKIIIPAIIALSLTMSSIFAVFTENVHAAGLDGNEKIQLFSASPFNGGTGTEEDPYLVSTEDQLLLVHDFPDCSFKLLNDIELTDTWNYIGYAGTNFTGVLDGDGHTIRNVTTTFIGTNDGIVKNLTLSGSGKLRMVTTNNGNAIIENCTIEGNNNSFAYINNGKIIRCAVKGDVTGTSKEETVGGFIYTNNGMITNCFVDGNIIEKRDYTTSQTYGEASKAYVYAYCAGFVGTNNGIISQSYVNSIINVNITAYSKYSVAHAYAYTAGFAYKNDSSGEIINCYSCAVIDNIVIATSGTSNENYTKELSFDCGFVFENLGEIANCYCQGSKFGFAYSSTGTTANCYYDKSLTNSIDTTYATPKSTLAMQMQATYTDWDFNTVWSIDSDVNDGYPYFQWDTSKSIEDITSIVLEPENVQIRQEETFIVIANVVPADTGRVVSWVSSNPNTASVDTDGVVTGVSEGNAVITATVGDKSAQMTVEVLPGSYVVTFVDNDGNTISTQDIKYNTAVGSLPEAPSVDGMRFIGYYSDNVEITAETIVTEAITATAKYVEETKYSVIFKNYDGAVLYMTSVNSGAAAVYGGESPTKSSDEQYSYTFVGWDKAFNNITEDTVVTAVFTQGARKYIVTFKNGDKVVSEQGVEYGKAAVAPPNPTKEPTEYYTYTFSGWDKLFDNITEDTVINATFTEAERKYSVIFKNGDEIVSEQSVSYGGAAETPASPIKAEDAQYIYTFNCWDKSFNSITDDMIINAVYDTTLKRYAVKFMYNGAQLNEVMVEYGSKIGTLPLAPVQVGYTFVGYFDGEIQITENTVITRTVTAIAKYIVNEDADDDNKKEGVAIENLIAENSEWSLNIKNYSENILNGVIIVALYDENNSLVSVAVEIVNENSDSKQLNGSFENYSAGTYCKAVFWDSMDNMNPLCDSVNISMK